MSETHKPLHHTQRVRAGLFLVLTIIVTIVMDGFPQAASPFAVQAALIPFSVMFLAALFPFLRTSEFSEDAEWLGQAGSEKGLLWAVVFLQLSFTGLFLFETHHYSDLGYRFREGPVLLSLSLALLLLFANAVLAGVIPASFRAVSFVVTYALGIVLAVISFPLTYLRSDMLPVIVWADRALLSGQNPYQHFYVADRIYDFPYLPGMLLAFVPTAALHLDPRWAGLIYLAGGMGLVYWASARRYRPHVALVIGVFILCPYLQYRHELYTQGHFLSLIVVFVLMQRRRFAWAAIVFGVSMLISQFSWVLFPFFLLNALRRGGWQEVGCMAGLSGATILLLLGPFVASGAGTIAHNSVGQWDKLARPIARPMNLSFWVSYVVRPVNLKWVQLAVLSAIFGYCWLKGRCADLADTLRWMIAALTVFILLNVLVDGYFYLMLLVPMLVYTCVANGWWAEVETRFPLPSARVVPV